MRWHASPLRWPVLLLIATLTALLLALSSLAATAARTQQLDPMAMQPLDQLSGTAFDQAFLTQMTMHHTMGVMMTQPVVTGGAHQELKTLGAQMISDQSREISQMRAWLQGWYAQDLTCPMGQEAMTGPGMGARPAHPGGMPMMPGMMPGAGAPMMPGGMPMMPGMMPGGPGGTMPMMGMPMMGMPMMGMPMMGMPMMSGFANLPPDQLDAAFMDWMIVHHQGAIAMAALADERAAHQEVKDLAANIITTQSAEIQMMTAWLAEWYGR